MPLDQHRWSAKFFNFNNLQFSTLCAQSWNFANTAKIDINKFMTLGPFDISELEQLEALFESKKIDHEIIVNEDKLKEIAAHNRENSRGRAYSVGLKVVHIEIADADFAKVAADLEKYGIAAPSDGSFELGEDDAN
jgi:hypothetical protein